MYTWYESLSFDFWIAATALFVAYLTFAYWRTFGLISLFIWAFAIIAGASLLVASQSLLFPETAFWAKQATADCITQMAVAILTVVYLPRLMIGLRSQMISPRSTTRFEGGMRPLPSQWVAINKLIENCGGGDNSANDTLERTPYEGKIVSINSSWGTGKTSIVRNFERLSNLPRVDSGQTASMHPVNLVVSYYNAWSNQMEPDPEYAIVRHLIADRRVMWPYGWLAVPAWRIIAKTISSAVRSLGGLKLKVSTVSVEGGLTPNPPSLNWTRTLENLAWCTWKRGPGGRNGASLVLIVDDVDRCAPLVAQNYVTLLRRGLNLPHLAIVLPYTANQLRYKVFDPLSVDLPDLGSSMEAAQADLVLGNGGRQSPFEKHAIGSREDILNGLSDDFDALIKLRRDGVLTGAGKTNDTGSKTTGSWVEAMNTWELMRRERLNQSYIQMVQGPDSTDLQTTEEKGGERKRRTPTVDRQLLRQFESKYVSDAPILLPRLSYLDIVQIVMDLPSVKSVVFGSVEQQDDGVKATLQYIIEQSCIKPARRFACSTKFTKPDFITDTRLGAIEDELSFEAQRKRTAIEPSKFEAVMAEWNAPSIRTVIAATEHLMQDDEFVLAMARTNEKTVQSSAFDENRYAVLLNGFDQIVLNAYSYLVE